jgi:hypothetical protein
MELKCSGGIPLWMTRVLSKERIYKTSFSKYGTAYQKFIHTSNEPSAISPPFGECCLPQFMKADKNNTTGVAYYA